MIRYSTLPSISRDRVNLAPTFLHRIMQSEAQIVYLPLMLFFASNMMFDCFNIYASIPGILGCSMIIIGSYQRNKALRSPLWMGK